MTLTCKLFALCLAISLFSFSQQMPIDFSDASDNFIPFFGSGFSFNTNPDDSSDAVGQFFNDGSDPSQGFYIDLSSDVDLSVQQQRLTLNFYQFDPNVHTITLKLENGSNPDVEVTQSNSGSGWTNGIIFDFANATLSGSEVTVNATGSYSRLVIFIDSGVAVSGTYLMDDINDGTEPVEPEIDVVYEDLVWSDEFDTPGGVDSDNWFHQTQVIIPGIGWANGEEQHYTNRLDNSFVDTNGFLNIVAKRETYTAENLEKDFTSGRLNSKFAFTYGRVDVRAKLPFGDGTWPAIWMLGKNINENGGFWDNQFGTTNWPACGEIDIMEHGIYQFNEIGAALHTPCCNSGSPNKGTVFAGDVANEFHTYSVNWSPDQMTFLLDGEIFYIYNPSNKSDANWPFYEDQYLLLNIAMGGVAGEISENFTESSMVIDYVRVYQNIELSVDDVFANKFKVFPNPASDAISIVTNEVIDAVEIYNILGSRISRQSSPNGSINISGLSPGMYFFNIYSGSKIVTKKIMVN